MDYVLGGEGMREYDHRVPSTIGVVLAMSFAILCSLLWQELSVLA